MGYNDHQGFSLIELVMGIAIIAVLSVGGASIFFYLMQNTVAIPQQLNTDMLASQALDVMVEGDGAGKGLRFSRSVVSVSDNQVGFYNQDSELIRYRFDTTAGKFFRSINGGAEAPLLGYDPPGITFRGKNNRVFQYYDSNEATTANPNAVRRIALTVGAASGSGDPDQWEGTAELATAVAVNRY